MIDPLLLFSKCFATWLRIRILMGFTIAWCIILIGISGAGTVSDGGDFSKIKFTNNSTDSTSSGTAHTYHTYSNWESAVCDAIPYVYLRPFYFTYTCNGATSSSTSYCAWPSNNSALRFTITVIGLVNLLLLYIKSPISLIARMLFTVYSLLFFAAFVLDTNSLVTGETNCDSNFLNTKLNTDISNAKIALNCNTSDSAVVVICDLILSILFFVLNTAWGLTTDLYVDRNEGRVGGKEKKKLLKTFV
jgi:hypothetical protein